MGAFAGYSLIVSAAGQTAAQEPPPPPIGARMDTLSPPDLDTRLAGEPNMRLLDLSCDLLVAGGGMAGVCAALAAARNGASVVLVQDRSRLGGNASSEVRMHIVGADHHGSRPGWREGGIMEELRLDDAVHNPHWAWELWDLLLYDKVVSEPNITLLLDSTLYAAETKDGIIERVLVRCDKTEHLYRVTARLYADCTGDCRLGLEAGAVLRTGQEGRDTFGESLAPERPEEGTLGSSILFTSKDYGRPIPFTPPAWARKITKDQLQHRGIGSWEYGYWWIEWGGHRDLVHDNARIRHELLAIVLGVWDYIKNSGEHPDSADWAMDWVGMVPGKRSSRRIEGPCILRQDDLMSGRVFEDAVAIGGWPIDIHPPTGIDDPSLPPFISTRLLDVYTIPLRCLYSANIGNLFMAGRNISTSHVAFGSTRVMATCAVEGQAIGTAAAQCACGGILPADITADPARVNALQQRLLRDDQSIKGVANADPADHARQATVTASATVDGSAPENVLDGFVRDMPGGWRHRWGGPMDGGEAWLELTWDTPRDLNEVQLTFDSGFTRGQLALTEQASQRRHQVRGPQPETVCNYTLAVRRTPGAPLETVAEVTGNHQRLRRHAIGPVKAASLRLTITATHGNEEARVYEIRCYG